MSVTLKQYLKAYQSAKQLASPSSLSTLHGEPCLQLEKAFNDKVKNLKINLRKYIDDEQAFSLFESQIDELNDIFHQNLNMFSVTKTCKNINENGSKINSHTKLLRSKRSSNRIVVPRISLEDQMIDVDENMTQGCTKRLRMGIEPAQIYHKKISSLTNIQQQMADFKKHVPQITKSPYMLHTIHKYDNQDGNNIQVQQKIRSSLKAQVSNENLNKWFNNKERLLVCPPPKLDKKNSCDQDDLRGTNRSNFISIESESFI